MSTKAFSSLRIKAGEMDDTFLNNPKSVAGQFSSSTAYAAGDYVYYNNKLYRFTAAHAAGAWTGSDASEATVSGELTALKADLTEMSTATSEDVGKALLAKTVADGKVTEWEFGDTGTEVETADVEINVIGLSDSVVVHESTTLNTDGAIGTGTGSSARVREYAIPAGCGKLEFKAFNTGTTADKRVWCLYDATTFAECSSQTLVASGNYVNDAYTVVDVPEDSKMLLIMARDAITYCRLYNEVTVEKSLLDFANPFDRLITYKAGNYCIHDGYLYLRKNDAEYAENWLPENWELVSYSSEKRLEESFLKYSPFVIGRLNTNTGSIIASTYSVISKDIICVDRDISLKTADSISTLNIYFYKNSYESSYISGQSFVPTSAGWPYLPKGSYIRIMIGDSNIQLNEDNINKIAGLVTFSSSYSKELDKMDEIDENQSSAEISNMYQKGASPKDFSLPQCILVAGQSNIDGRVPHASLPSELDVALPNIMFGNSSGVFSPVGAPSGSVGIAWSMFYALNGLGTTFYEIKKSMGGTAISPLGSTKCWTPFYEELADISNSLLLEFDKLIKKCVEANSNTFNIRAFVWQQGEGDYTSQSGGPRISKKSIDYYNNFKCLVAYVRGVAGNKRLPVVCGTVSHRSVEYDPYIESATLKVAAEDPYMICIDMSGAKLLDTAHFDADSAVYFGYKAFDALIDLGVITATKINPTRPWEEYTVTEEFTNCYSNAYANDTVRYDGQGLTRKIFADTGYTLDTVTVTMGGTDITETAYSNGTITISDVEGDIVITATATAN